MAGGGDRDRRRGGSGAAKGRARVHGVGGATRMGSIDEENALADSRRARVGAGPLRGEYAGANFGQAAGTGDSATKGGGLGVAADVDGINAEGEVIRSFQATQLIGVGSNHGKGHLLRAAGPGIKCAVAEDAGVGERQGAAVDDGIAGVLVRGRGIRTRQGESGVAVLDQGNGAGDAAVINPVRSLIHCQGGGGSAGDLHRGRGSGGSHALQPANRLAKSVEVQRAVWSVTHPPNPKQGVRGQGIGNIQAERSTGETRGAPCVAGNPDRGQAAGIGIKVSAGSEVDRRGGEVRDSTTGVDHEKGVRAAHPARECKASPVGLDPDGARDCDQTREDVGAADIPQRRSQAGTGPRELDGFRYRDVTDQVEPGVVCLVDRGIAACGSQCGIVRDGEHPLIYQSRSRVRVPSGQTKGAGSGFGQSPRAGDGPVDGLVVGIADREIRRAFDDDIRASGAGQGADGHRSGGIRTGDLHGLAIGQADGLGIGAGVDDDGASGRNRGEGLGQGGEGVDLENRALAAGGAKVGVTDRLAGVLGEAVVHIDH